MGILNGKRILVTGGSRGIGAEIVRATMKEGAEVAFVFRSQADAADELSQQMATRYSSQRCVGMQCDVTDANAMRETIEEVTVELGRIDVLVNNAGVTRDAAFARMSAEQWNDVINTNLGSMFNATQPLVMQLVRQRSGAIINMTSVAGIYGSGGQTNYSASKAGIVGFTKALAKEISPFGVRVNAVAPGFIETDMIAKMDSEKLRLLKARIPAGRLGLVNDVAELVCFLASDKASYITGQVIQVDGGLTL
jgi:3-oxoacyl-[acyl-carrier protein] reductase